MEITINNNIATNINSSMVFDSGDSLQHIDTSAFENISIENPHDENLPCVKQHTIPECYTTKEDEPEMFVDKTKVTLHDGVPCEKQHIIPDHVLKDKGITDVSSIEKSPAEIAKIVLNKTVHINPLSTEIDLETVAYQLSNYQFAPGMTVSVDELIDPKYGMDYEAHPANA